MAPWRWSWEQDEQTGAVGLGKVLMLVLGYSTERDCQESEFPGVEKLW